MMSEVVPVQTDLAVARAPELHTQAVSVGPGSRKPDADRRVQSCRGECR